MTPWSQARDKTLQYRPGLQNASGAPGMPDRCPPPARASSPARWRGTRCGDPALARRRRWWAAPVWLARRPADAAARLELRLEPAVVGDAAARHRDVLGPKLDQDGVALQAIGDEAGGAGAAEGIEDGGRNDGGGALAGRAPAERRALALVA